MSTVQMIPTNKIHVLNPRARNRTKFAEIGNSISKIGVKKPITICPRAGSGGEYDLVCGQGRLEAVAGLGITHIPAFVVDATPDKRYLMSLIEKLARCHPDSLALVRGIAALERRGGYSAAQIAEKIGISEKYVRSILRLHAKGEELLLAAVERGDLPIHVAVEIATAKDGDVKRCLAEAYERGDLKGKAVSKARALVERRLANGKRTRGGPRQSGHRQISADELRSRVQALDAEAGDAREACARLRVDAAHRVRRPARAHRGRALRHAAPRREARQDAQVPGRSGEARSRVVKSPFLLDTITLALEKILPSEALKPGLKTSARYKMIEASVREVGIIEPLVVYPELGKSGTYMLLDGHVRLEVLRGLGHSDVVCLVATDDESCTYNIRVSRLAPIQEYRMILKAIDAGVPEESIARALNVATKTIRESRNKLTDITAEAIDRLKDKPIAEQALRLLKKVKPYRQVEMAELMALSNTYTASYAKALLAATSEDQLVAPLKPDSRPEQIAKLETEMRAIERDFVVLEESYSRDTLNLQLARGYLKAVLGNGRVARHLGQKHAELLAQLQRVCGGLLPRRVISLIYQRFLPLPAVSHRVTP